MSTDESGVGTTFLDSDELYALSVQQLDAHMKAVEEQRRQLEIVKGQYVDRPIGEQLVDVDEEVPTPYLSDSEAENLGVPARPTIESPEAFKYRPAYRTAQLGYRAAVDNLNKMSDRQKLGLAYDMFVNVSGAYGSFSEITGDDGEIDPDTFIAAWERTFQLAQYAGPAQLNFTTKYFDILMRDYETGEEISEGEYTILFEEAEAQSGELVDVANTNYLLTQRLAPLLGRRPTTLDQRRFFRFMQEQSLSRPRADPGALTDEFIQNRDPELQREFNQEESKRAARGVLSVITGG